MRVSEIDSRLVIRNHLPNAPSASLLLEEEDEHVLLKLPSLAFFHALHRFGRFHRHGLGCPERSGT